MTRLASVLSLVFVTASIVASSACGVADQFSQDEAQAHQDRLSADCHQAGQRCEAFVTAICDRGDQCGGNSFDKCTSILLNGNLPCEKATLFDDPTQCDADFASLSCSDVANSNFPDSCNSLQFEFGDSVCQ